MYKRRKIKYDDLYNSFRNKIRENHFPLNGDVIALLISGKR